MKKKKNESILNEIQEEIKGKKRMKIEWKYSSIYIFIKCKIWNKGMKERRKQGSLELSKPYLLNELINSGMIFCF